jgi:hypothetical protein
LDDLLWGVGRVQKNAEDTFEGVGFIVAALHHYADHHNDFLLIFIRRVKIIDTEWSTDN